MSRVKGAVSAGHKATVQTAAEVLKDGGNAFDAVVAAHMTACVVEPVLASFAGGGFLLAETSDGQQTLYDFFVQTPKKIKKKEGLRFFPISADFGYALQEFHIGPGSVATPGTVKGLFKIHKDLCTMPFKRLAEPAIDLAREGVEMNAFQAGALDITKPIYFSNREATEIFGSQTHSKRLIQTKEWFKQPFLGDFIEQLAKAGESFFYEGEIADRILQLCRAEGGHLTAQDLEDYQVVKRDPFRVNYRNSVLMVNPPPSSGGLLIAFALKLMEAIELNPTHFNSANYPVILAEVQDLTNRARVEKYTDKEAYKKSESLLHAPFLDLYKEEIKARWQATRGTTQISIMDREGNTASLTTSNGSGSGVMIPGTGVMLNNMLGEEDLNPQGFYKWPQDQRISSMMAPAILHLKKGERVALGSGGSNRIRTAILQVLLNLVDGKMEIEEAVEAPRIHFEKDVLNIEKGWSDKTIENFKVKYPGNKIWEYGNLFFGGTHAVTEFENRFSGCGDPRRGGVSIVVEK